MSQTYRINEPSVASETIDGEVVVINLETGSYFSMQKVAGRIWESVTAGMTAERTAERLRSIYRTNGIDVKARVSGFLRTLIDEGLIVEAPASVSTNGSITEASDEDRPALPFEDPILSKFTDMQELLFLDPIHEVDEAGWPNIREEPQDGSAMGNTRDESQDRSAATDQANPEA